MRIVLTGGGSGGHFYPLIAVVEAIEDICKERTLLEPNLYYTGPEPFDKTALLEHAITYLPSHASRMRRYASTWNVIGFFSTAIGIVRATTQLFGLYPDVIFSTGGFAAFPTLCAARLLRIPVVIYDADATPGRVSLWSAAFAQWIALAHPNAAERFPAHTRGKIAHVGHPIRREIEAPAKEGGYEFLKLDPSVPTIFIVGGSQGAVAINTVVLNALPDLLNRYNIVHQAGSEHADEVGKIAAVVLREHSHRERYRVFGLLNTLALRVTAGIAALVVSRAGSGTIFEIASWGIPALLVPIPEDVSHDQTENAFSYARTGACIVIEQRNLTPHILAAEIDRIIADDALQENMRMAARNFAKPQAARKIAAAILDIAIEHEPV